ncbi:MAG: hypothetical protein QW469_03505 [Candidatus Aenigmatarchaeota archaeon]
MKKIILDTNFLIDSIKFKIDLYEQLKGFDIYTIKPVIEEINSISKSCKKDSKYAKLVLKIYNKIKIIEITGNSDDILLNLSNEYIIATQDSVLRKKIKNKKGKLAYIRQKKYIVLEE